MNFSDCDMRRQLSQTINWVHYLSFLNLKFLFVSSTSSAIWLTELLKTDWPFPTPSLINLSSQMPLTMTLMSIIQLYFSQAQVNNGFRYCIFKQSLIVSHKRLLINNVVIICNAIKFWSLFNGKGHIKSLFGLKENWNHCNKTFSNLQIKFNQTLDFLITLFLFYLVTW